MQAALDQDKVILACLEHWSREIHLQDPGDPVGWCSHPLPDRGASPTRNHLKKQGVCWVLQRGGGFRLLDSS